MITINKKTLVKIFLVSMLLALILCNFSENLITIIAAKTMNFFSGNGFNNISIDNNGLPVSYYARLHYSTINPVYACIYGLKYYKKFNGSTYQVNSKDKSFTFAIDEWKEEGLEEIPTNKAKDYFINVSNWLINNGEKIIYNGKECIIYKYDFDWPTYQIKAPWYSGMAQGLALSVLLRAYNITNKDIYLKTAEKVYNVFSIPVINGGVSYFDNENEIWFEEYAKNGAKETRVFNGMVYAMLGVFEYESKVSKNSDLLIKAQNSLNKNIGKYDSGWWTYYDQVGTIDNIKYHKIDTELLKDLYKITEDSTYLGYYEKWSNFNTPFIVREFLRQKPHYIDIVILGYNFLISFFIVTFFIFFAKIVLMLKNKVKDKKN